MPLYLVAYVLPIVLMLLAVPLVLGKVSPNWLLGFRTRKTVSSPAIWYRANRVAGWLLIAASALAICFNAALWSLHPDWPREVLMSWMLRATIASVLLASILSTFYLRKL